MGANADRRVNRIGPGGTPHDGAMVELKGGEEVVVRLGQDWHEMALDLTGAKVALHHANGQAMFVGIGFGEGR